MSVIRGRTRARAMAGGVVRSREGRDTMWECQGNACQGEVGGSVPVIVRGSEVKVK